MPKMTFANKQVMLKSTKLRKRKEDKNEKKTAESLQGEKHMTSSDILDSAAPAAVLLLCRSQEKLISAIKASLPHNRDIFVHISSTLICFFAVRQSNIKVPFFTAGTNNLAHAEETQLI